MSILILSPSPSSAPAPVARAAPARRVPLLRGRRLGSPRDPGLSALALGLLAVTAAVHPLWALASPGFGLAGAALGAVALAEPGERRAGSVGLACAVLGLVFASVTVPAAVQGGAVVLAWFAGLRPGGA